MNQKLKNARSFIIANDPFFASLLVSMELVVVDDGSGTFSTNCVDKIYVDQNILPMMSEVVVLKTLYHELYHKVYLHNVEIGKVDHHDIMNMAMDFVINLKMEEYWTSSPIFDTVRNKTNTNLISFQDIMSGNLHDSLDSFLYDEQFLDMSCHEVYNFLLSNLPKDIIQCLYTFSHGVIDENVMSLEGQKAAITSALSYAQGLGDIDEDFANELKDLYEPRINWKTVVRNWLHRSFEDEISNHKPHYLSESFGFFIPGINKNEKLSIAFAVDMSGSMSYEDRLICATELNSVVRQLDIERLEFISFTSEVNNHQTFLSDDPFTPEFLGMGGTALQPVYELVSDLNVNALVVVTDGWLIDWYPYPKDFPIFFINTASNNHHYPKYGRSATWKRN